MIWNDDDLQAVGEAESLNVNVQSSQGLAGQRAKEEQACSDKPK
jgi:hypothetical protein